jgi:putative ABC transport system substrate-binding protein
MQRRELSLGLLRGTRSEKEMTMQRKTVRLIVMLVFVLLTAPCAAHAQPATKVYRIGYVRPGTAAAIASWDEAFKQRLQELGYTEGQNLIIEARYAQGDVARLPALVAEVLRLQVDCLAVGGVDAARIAKQATSTIPIVMLNASDDPVRLGLITSFARPGGNITGVVDILRSNWPANAWNC